MGIRQFARNVCSHDSRLPTLLQRQDKQTLVPTDSSGGSGSQELEKIATHLIAVCAYRTCATGKINTKNKFQLDAKPFHGRSGQSSCISRAAGVTVGEGCYFQDGMGKLLEVQGRHVASLRLDAFHFQCIHCGWPVDTEVEPAPQVNRRCFIPVDARPWPPRWLYRVHHCNTWLGDSDTSPFAAAGLSVISPLDMVGA